MELVLLAGFVIALTAGQGPKKATRIPKDGWPPSDEEKWESLCLAPEAKA